VWFSLQTGRLHMTTRVATGVHVMPRAQALSLIPPHSCPRTFFWMSSMNWADSARF
jgi:hypothetical protein